MALSYNTELAQRLRDQGRDHWREFGVIVASANTGLAILLLGTALTSELNAPARVALWGIAGASLLATTVAYYSIEVGSLLVFGRLRLRQTLLSFAVAGSELSMMLWPLHVTRGGSGEKPDAIIAELRHWLLFFAAFALAAAAANWDGAISRRDVAEHLPAELLGRYGRRQRRDRLSAGAAGGVSVALWLTSGWLSPLVALCAGIATGTIGMTVALISQSSTSAALEQDVQQT